MPNSDEASGRGVPKGNKQPFKVSKYKQFIYNKVTPGKVVASEFIRGIKSTLTLLKTASPPELPTEKPYPLGKVSINKKKIDHLKKLMEYTVGYEAIIQWPTTDQELLEDLPEAE
ncbi:uncharacterized protein LOC130901373 [Diorhabda carinulata]|uniref:uncharacterized protein LOC130901373 n=1 Tax=Diorhabda carinulata TaxID=1163345 RepID=UPI0025A073A2|nr:uncharacterized protein LOC130901373 [Diorhabda carinulata]